MPVQRSRTTDLTNGNPYRLIISFALPILLGQVFQNLYNSVDSIIVGNYVGKTALAAVSSCSDISMLLTGFFTGFSTGSGVLFARYFGAKKYDDLHDAIHTALAFAFAIGIILALTGVLLTPVLLKIVACPEDVLKEATDYLRIYLIGILFTAIYNVASGVLRAVGDSRSPLYYLIITSIANIILDTDFVALLKWGVIGAAAATILSQLLSCFLIFRNMLRTKDVYRFVPRDLKIRKEYLGQIIDLGIPAAIQASLISISNLFVQRYINLFGSSAMAGVGAAKKIDKFIGIISQSIGLAATTYASQNLGAKKTDRAMGTVRVCMLLALGSIVLLGTPVYIFAPQSLRIFTSDAEAINYGVAMVRVILPLYVFQSANAIYANVVRGFGKSRQVMLFSVFGMIVCRQIFLGITMSVWHDIRFVYVGFPVGWGCAAIFCIIYYYRMIARMKKEQRTAEAAAATESGASQG